MAPTSSYSSPIARCVLQKKSVASLAITRLRLAALGLSDAGEERCLRGNRGARTGISPCSGGKSLSGGYRERQGSAPGSSGEMAMAISSISIRAWPTRSRIDAPPSVPRVYRHPRLLRILRWFLRGHLPPPPRHSSHFSSPLVRHSPNSAPLPLTLFVMSFAAAIVSRISSLSPSAQHLDSGDESASIISSQGMSILASSIISF